MLSKTFTLLESDSLYNISIDEILYVEELLSPKFSAISGNGIINSIS